MREAWGKFDKETKRHHPLAHHSMDVAAVFARLLELPVIRSRLETAAGRTLGETDRQRLAALVFLHDIGKLHPGFQAKGWPEELWKQPKCGHQSEGWAFLALACSNQTHPFHETMLQLFKWGDAAETVIAAAFSHHGRPVLSPTDPRLSDWRVLSHYDWRSHAGNMASAMRHWFPAAFGSGTVLPDVPCFHHLVAGLASLADWIGSNIQFFPFRPPFDRAYDAVAHDGAKRALATIGLDLAALKETPAPSFDQLTGGLRPNGAQRTVAGVDVDSRLVILEAETGSGKTEAALWRYTKLLAAGKVSGLYFAVPTRAAARQLHRRVDQAIRRVYGSRAPEAVLAIPGMVRSGDFEGQRLPNWEVLWDDQKQAPHRWAAEHATRFLAAPIAVGTVDQAMLSALKVKHAHLRGSALSRSLLVVDEVHASDSYMTEVLLKLTDQHLAVGGYAMLMSATLGTRARVRWTGDALSRSETAKATRFPAVWVAGRTDPLPVEGGGRSKRVRMITAATMAPQHAAELAAEAAGRGARVLLIRNTVTMAVETWQCVQDIGQAGLLMEVAGGPALHHSRFAVEDRQLLDAATEDALAHDRPPGGTGRIVIGTQTLEQSLDIDADLLITDLCPIDVLLQRIGRLHRHELARPTGFEEAAAVVLLPDGGLDRLAAPDFYNGLGAWQREGGFMGVYRDLPCLALTRGLIEAHGEWRIPAMNRELVEGATHPDLIARLLKTKDDRWQRYQQTASGTEAAARMVAGLNVLDRQGRFEELRIGSDERVLTRLGEEGVILPLNPPVTGPFGAPISRVALPARWSTGITGEDEPTATGDETGLDIAVAEQRFRYSRSGLRRLDATGGTT